MNFCSSTWEIWQLVGRVVTIFKIVIPVILILFGVMDLGKAVVSKEDNEITKASTKLAKRAAAGILIFFIPTLVNYVFTLVDSAKSTSSDSAICSACVADPDSCKAKAGAK